MWVSEYMLIFSYISNFHNIGVHKITQSEHSATTRPSIFIDTYDTNGNIP